MAHMLSEFPSNMAMRKKELYNYRKAVPVTSI